VNVCFVTWVTSCNFLFYGNLDKGVQKREKRESQMQKHVFLPLVSLLSHSNGAGNREAKMAF